MSGVISVSVVNIILWRFEYYRKTVQAGMAPSRLMIHWFMKNPFQDFGITLNFSCTDKGILLANYDGSEAPDSLSALIARGPFY